MADEKTPVKLKGKRFVPVWSGNKLSKMYESFRGADLVGESWETSVEDGYEASVATNDKIMMFSDYLSEIDGKIPPLVKFLDAALPLSVQVHPDDTAASKLGGISKSEIWYVLNAEDNSYILYGTLENAAHDKVKSAIIDGNIESILNKIYVKTGDVYMIPAGMIHSLGAGITVLEVQNRAGTTYRVKDIAGNRATHVSESIESLHLYSIEEAARMAVLNNVRLHNTPIPGEIIAATYDFAVTKYTTCDKEETLTLSTGGVYMFCEYGNGFSGNLRFNKGDSVYFPSDDSVLTLYPDSSVIFVV